MQESLRREVDATIRRVEYMFSRRSFAVRTIPTPKESIESWAQALSTRTPSWTLPRWLPPLPPFEERGGARKP